MEYAPIVLFTYCRPLHTQQTVTALLENPEAKHTQLFIYSDAPKNAKVQAGVEATRCYIHSIKGFKSIHIIERERNWGLANSLIDGITTVVQQYGRVIVVEDDIVVSPHFLKYMNDGLDLYAHEEKVASIHAYIYPTGKKLPETFFIKGADCWGWATWKRAWDIFNPDGQALLDEIIERKLERDFDFDYSYPYVSMLRDQIEGKISSWAIRWNASAFLKDMYTLYPGQPLARQIGMDDKGGTHCGQTSVFDVTLLDTPIQLKKIEVTESKAGKKAFIYFFLHKLMGKKYCRHRRKKILIDFWHSLFK